MCFQKFSFFIGWPGIISVVCDHVILSDIKRNQEGVRDLRHYGKIRAGRIQRQWMKKLGWLSFPEDYSIRKGREPSCRQECVESKCMRELTCKGTSR